MNGKSIQDDLLQQSDRISGLDTILDTIALLDERLLRTTYIIDALNNRLSHLLIAEASFSPGRAVTKPYDAKDEGQVTVSEKEHSSYYGSVGKNKDSDKNDFIESIKSVHELAESSKKVAEVFEDLSPKVKTVKNVLGSIGDLTDGVTGIGELFSAAEGGMTAVEGLGTAAEIMAGAAGIAEIGAALGPAGWIAGISALAIGGVAAAVISDSKDDRTGYINTDASRQRKIFEEQEKQTDFEKLLVAEGVKNAYGREEARKENNAPYMIAAREKHVDAKMTEWQNSIDDMRKRTPIDISPLTQKYLSLTQEQNQAFVEQYLFHNSSNLANDLAFEDDLKKVNEKYDRAIARLPQNKNTILEKDKLKQGRQNEVDMLQEKYTPGHLLLPLGRTQNMRLATDEDLENDKRQRMGLALKPKGEPIKPTARTARISPRTHGFLSQQNGRVININLNKPMIEHFTINAKEVREGVNDFKNKVEEVLLEILNSANTIQ